MRKSPVSILDFPTFPPPTNIIFRESLLLTQSVMLTLAQIYGRVLYSVINAPVCYIYDMISSLYYRVEEEEGVKMKLEK